MNKKFLDNIPFGSIFDEHEAVMLLIDPRNGQICRGNQAAVRFYGYPPEIMCGMALSHINVESREVLQGNMENATQGSECRFEVMHQLANGEIRKVDVHTSVVHIEDEIHLYSIVFDITEQIEAEHALAALHKDLALRVERRTHELENEIAQRRKAEAELKKNELRLVKKRAMLEESNIALQRVISEIETQQHRFEEAVTTNLLGLVEPYVKKLKRTRLSDLQKGYVEIISRNLKNMLSTHVYASSAINLRLTVTEVQVVNFIRQGYKTKEIAEVMNISTKTVDKHRASIRRKVGISGQKVNLATLLTQRAKV